MDGIAFCAMERSTLPTAGGNFGRMGVEDFKLQAERVELAIGFDFELQARSDGFRFVAGVDEVGRGCLAGPVVAAACILDCDAEVPAKLNDSKKLTA